MTGEPVIFGTVGLTANFFNPRPSSKTGERSDSLGDTSSTGFNPRPSSKTGERGQGAQGHGQHGVSIHARHRRRANAAKVPKVTGSMEFQSTPVIEDG
jgi:hypothetical protein